MRLRWISTFLFCSTALFAQSPARNPDTVQARTDALHTFSSSIQELTQRVNRSVVQIFTAGYSIGGTRGEPQLSCPRVRLEDQRGILKFKVMEISLSTGSPSALYGS